MSDIQTNCNTENDMRLNEEEPFRSEHLSFDDRGVCHG